MVPVFNRVAGVLRELLRGHSARIAGSAPAEVTIPTCGRRDTRESRGAGGGWSKVDRVLLPRLKPSTETISLRLPESLLNELRVLSNQRDVPYPYRFNIFPADRIEIERRRKAG